MKQSASISQSSRKSSTTGNILVVDDSETKRYYVKRVLENAGFVVSEAQTGEKCLEIAAQTSPDLIVLDIRLPDINGYEVCRRLKADPKTATIAVLHLSASFINSADEAYGLDEGADGYLTQPVEPPVLLAHVKALMRLRHAEEEAREKAVQWQATFDAIADGILLVDRQGKIVLSNQALGELLDWKQSSIAGESFDQLFTDTFGKFEADRLFNDFLRLGRTTIEAPLNERHISISIDPVDSRQHSRSGQVCIFSDITQRKLSEEALRESNERFHILTENITDYAIVLLDPQGYIKTWNAGVFRILGYDEHELVGMHMSALFSQGDQEAGIPDYELEQARKNRQSEDKRWHVRKDGSTFWSEGVITVFRDKNSDVDGFIKIMRDRTAQKLAEDSLAESLVKQSRIAETLQRSLLQAPPEDKFPGVKLFTAYESALDEALVGGDFYDAFALNKDKIAFVVGDVAGKGLLAASRTVEVKYAFRAFMHDSPSPADALTKLNRLLFETDNLELYGHDGFVVMSVAVLDITKRALAFSGAGGEPLLLIRNEGDIQPLRSPGIVLGIGMETDYLDNEIALNNGETLLMMTDGITEARTGMDFLDWEGVVDIVHRHGVESGLENIANAVLDGARAFSGGVLRDDACLLLARLDQDSTHGA